MKEGDIYIIGGKKLIAVATDSICEGCYFHSKEECAADYEFETVKCWDREGNNLIFVPVENEYR